jgi:hypothetical protein
MTDISPDQALHANYQAYVNAAKFHVAQLLGNMTLKGLESESDAARIALELPHFQPGTKLQLVYPESIVLDDDEVLMLRMIQAYYKDTFPVAMQFSNPAYVNAFYRDAAQIMLAHFLDTIGQRIWRRKSEPGVILEVLGLIDELSSLTYEGKAATITVMIRRSRETPHTRVYLGRDLIASKKTARLFSGAEHVITANLEGIIVGVEAPKVSRLRRRVVTHPVAANYQVLASYAHRKSAMVFALAPNGDISIIAERRTIAMRQHGTWRLVGTTSFVHRLAETLCAIGNSMSFVSCSETANFLTMLALSLNHRREGALLVVVPSRIPAKLRSATRLSAIEQTYQELLTPRSLSSVPVSLLLAALSIDGATFISSDRMVIAFGQILMSPHGEEIAAEGARTRAAATASKYGVALKISADGPITIHADGRVVGELLGHTPRRLALTADPASFSIRQMRP